MTHRLSRAALASLALMAFLWIGTFGILAIGLHPGWTSGLTGCADHAGMCPMSPAAHASMIENFLSAVPRAFSSLLFALATSAAFFGALSFLQSRVVQPASRSGPPREYARRVFSYAPSGTLREAFARGVLHSKAY